MDFKDEAFRLTHKDLRAYLAFCFSLFIFLVGPALIVIAVAEALLGDFEGWGVWTRVWITGAAMAVMLATVWVILRVSKSRWDRWFDERKVPAEDITDEESRQTSGRQPPNEGDAASVGPSG